MKTTILLFLVVAFFVPLPSMKAQETSGPKNEIKLGYGVVTAPEIGTSFALMFLGLAEVIDKDTIKDLSISSYGAVNLSYEREIKKWIGVGVTGVFNPISINSTTTNGFNFSYIWYVTSVMPYVNFYYLRKEYVALYSGVAVGGSMIVEVDYSDQAKKTTQTDLTYAYQLNFFGFRVGKQIAGFAEFGFGWKGIVNFGISAKL